MVSPSTCATLVERERIGSAGKVDQDLIVYAFGCIVFRQLSTKPSRLDANRGIEMGVEITRPPKDLRSNLIFFGRSPGVLQRVIGEVAQQFAQGFGTMQGMTAEEFFNLTAVLSLVRQLSHPWPVIVTPSNTNVTRFAHR